MSVPESVGISEDNQASDLFVSRIAGIMPREDVVYITKKQKYMLVLFRNKWGAVSFWFNIHINTVALLFLESVVAVCIQTHFEQLCKRCTAFYNKKDNLQIVRRLSVEWGGGWVQLFHHATHMSHLQVEQAGVHKREVAQLQQFISCSVWENGREFPVLHQTASGDEKRRRHGLQTHPVSGIGVLYSLIISILSVSCALLFIKTL